MPVTLLLHPQLVTREKNPLLAGVTLQPCCVYPEQSGYPR